MGDDKTGAKSIGLGDDWTNASNAIAHLEYAVRRGLGPDVVRRALHDAATDLAIFVDRAGEKDLAARTAAWRRRIRPVVNASGENIDEAALEALYGDVATAQVKAAMTRQATGVAVGKQADGDYALKAANGDTLLTLPRLAGHAVVSDPEKYGAQIKLLLAAANVDDPETLRRHAFNVFSNLHEREHEFLERRLLYAPTDARAGAFVNGVARLREATTPAEKTKAEAILRTALFAEAAPGKRLAYLGLDLLTPVGNANAAVGFSNEVAAAQKDFSEGRYLDGAMHTVWSAVEFTGAVSGIKAGKILREVAKTTPIGRRTVAALDLAKKMAASQRKHASVPAVVIMGRRKWAEMDDDQRGYIEGVLNNAKGQVGEAHMTQVLNDVGANSFKHKEAIKKAQGQKPTPPPEKPTRIKVKDQPRGGTRVFDDATVGETIHTFMGFFARPKSAPGKTTLIEHKAAGASKTPTQVELQEIMEKRKKEFGHLDIVDLHTPYSDLNKDALSKTIRRMLTAPNLMGQKYVTSGVYKTDKQAPSAPARYIKWEENELNKILKAAERSLELQKWGDRAPTLGDFMLGFTARLSAATENNPARSSVPRPPKPTFYNPASQSEFND